MKKQFYTIISIIGLSVMLPACSGGENPENMKQSVDNTTAKVESGLDVVSGQTDDFIGTLEVLEESE